MNTELINYNGGKILVDNETPIQEGQIGYSINNVCYTHFNHLGEGYGRRILAQTMDVNPRVPLVWYIELDDDSVCDTMIENILNLAGMSGDFQTAINGLRIFFVGTYTKADIIQALRQGEANEGDSQGLCDGCSMTDEAFIDSLKREIESVELEMKTQYLINGKWRPYLLPSEWNYKNKKREYPFTYDKNGVSFVRIKSIKFKE